MLLDYLWDWISTHAPHAGSDTTSIRPMAACPNFNSRSPCRERPLVAGKEMLLLLFQSTLPLRGATAAAILKIHRLPISTHAPHAGSDTRKKYFGNVVSIFQPTLPMRGATGRGKAKKANAFISTHAPHAGSDLCSCTKELTNYAISTHAPHAGSDMMILQAKALARMISTHAPHAGSDLPSVGVAPSSMRFQPTLPMRGATKSV